MKSYFACTNWPDDCEQFVGADVKTEVLQNVDGGILTAFKTNQNCIELQLKKRQPIHFLV